MFFNKDKEKRSIEDILTIKDEVVEESQEGEDVVVKEDNVENSSETISASDCFGMDEGKTEKWMLKCVKIWYYAISFIWFLLGSITFAPVIFISSKINVVFKSKKKSLFVSFAIYLAIVLLFVLLFALRNNTNVATP